MIKRLIPYLAAILSILALTACNGGYDASECERLTDKIVNEETLSQDDYSDMLTQYESILQYLIDRTDKTNEISDDFERAKEQQALRQDEEFMKRFSYMFTFGSALYMAEVGGELDDSNLERYNKVMEYVDEFTKSSERF